MKSLILALVIMGSGYAVSGCGFSCNALGCDTGVHITAKGVATKFSSLLPFVIKACSDDGSCRSVTIRQTDGVFVCDEGDGPGFANCKVTPAGDVSYDLGFTKTPKDDVAAITVNVQDSAETTVFTGTASTELEDIEINGDGCGVTCQQGDVLFVP